MVRKKKVAGTKCPAAFYCINTFAKGVGGRAFIHSEPYGKDDAYEYIRGNHDNLNGSVSDCVNS